MKPVVEQLSSGLKVALAPNHASNVVAFQMWVGVGSADEREGEEGLAHVFEHMLFKGTEKRAVGEITRDVERVGGQINAWTSPDETVFYITLASRYWPQGLSILADAISNPLLDEVELQRELSVIREEIRMGEDSPERTVTRSLFKSLYKKHPYGRPVIGYDRTVKGFLRKNVVDFYHRWYVPKNMVLAIAGDFEIDEMMKEVRAVLGHMDPGCELPLRSTRLREALQRRPRVSFVVKPISEVHFALGFPIPGLLHGDIPALDLLAAIVGQGASSRLEGQVRRKAGLVNGIRAMSYTPVDAGLFGVFATIPPAKLERACKAILKELADLKENPVSSEEIKKARTLLESDKVYSEETVDGIGRKLGFYSLHANDVEFEDKYLSAVSRQGPDDLIEAANRYLKPETLNIAVVVPDPRRHEPETKITWISGRGSSSKINKNKLKTILEKRIEAFKDGPARRKKVARTDVETMVHQMDTGDVLIIRCDPSSKLVAARAAFWGGNRLEKPEKSGVYALLANLLNKGADGMSAEEVALKMDSEACSIDGFSGRNTIGICGEFLNRNFEEGFSLMARCLRKPSFLEGEVELEKALLKEDIKSSQYNPGYLVFKLFASALFGSHPYGRPVWGTLESIDLLSIRDLKSHHRSATAQGSMVMAVEGGADFQTVVDLVESQYLTNGKKRKSVKPPKDWSEPDSPVQVTQHMPKEQSHVVVGFQGTRITSPDRFAVEVLTEILGGHGGRLFETVREKKGLAYSVTASSLAGVEPGYNALYAATSPGKETAVVDAMLLEVERIRAELTPENELHRVKRHLVGSRAIARQRASARAANMALDYLYGNGQDEAERYERRIDAVSAEDIREVAVRYLKPKKRIVVCVGPNVESLSLV